MTDPIRYAIYARQSLSRDPADSLSIEMQVKACREFVAQRAGVVVGEYTDPDTKGWRRYRPGFDAMLEQVRRGDAQTIVLYKLSRFARNLMMQEDVVTMIADAGGDLVSVTEPHVSTSPMVRQILGAVNEQYRRDQGDWLRSTWAARARRGLHHGYAPYGYRIEDKRLVLDPDTAPIAREIWTWALEGHGTPEITYRLNERNRSTNTGKPWYQTAVLRMLRNPVYAGHVLHRDEIVARDAHPAIVTDAEYDQVQATIDRRANHRRKAVPSWAEGFVWHACGRRMYLASWAKGDDVRTRFRCAGVWPDNNRREARCPHRPASMFASKVESAIVDQVGMLGDRLIPPDAVAAELEAVAGASSRDREQRRVSLQRRLDDLDRQRDRLLDLVLSERIDADLYRDRDDAIKAEIAAVTIDRDAVPAPIDPAQITAMHASLHRIATAARIAARHDPASLVQFLADLDARLILGDGDPRLEVGASLAPYVR